MGDVEPAPGVEFPPGLEEAITEMAVTFIVGDRHVQSLAEPVHHGQPRQVPPGMVRGPHAGRDYSDWAETFRVV